MAWSWGTKISMIIDPLRLDPIHGLIAGKSDPLGEDRILERDKGKPLAAQSTLNRLELSAEAIDVRYRKIQAQPEQIEQLLIKRGVKAIPRRSAENVLDLDATWPAGVVNSLYLRRWLGYWSRKANCP
jgi:hypothetical protein